MRLTIRNSDGTVSQPMNLDWAAALEKLAAYEDAEDQGRMVILPCAVEDAVYYINPDAIGKTVFFTREEAESALKGETQDV